MPLHGDALVAIDKLDKIGVDGVRAGARDARHRRGRDETLPRALRSGARSDGLAIRCTGCEQIVPAMATAALAKLARSSRLVDGTPAAGRIRVDPSLARGLSYYTGAIMEIAVPDLAGSLGGGGRYDNLIGMFLGRDVPACGFSLGLERIIVVMTERKMFPAAVASGAAGRDGDVLERRVAGPTRWRWRRSCARGGLRVDVYPEADKLGQAVQVRLEPRTCRSSPIVGDDERGARRGDGQGSALAASRAIGGRATANRRGRLLTRS